MKTIARVKPINYRDIENLDFTRYILIFMDENLKLKRGIPDFDETFISKQESLIDDAMTADRIGVFKILPRNAVKRDNEIIFMVDINDNGEITPYNNYADNNVKLENFLLNKEQRENVSKLLKIRR